MAISLVQQTSGLDTAGATGSVSVAFGSNNTAGNMIIAVLIGSDTTNTLFNTEFANITDSRNTYIKVFDQFETTWQVGMKIFVAYNVGAGANTVTCSADTSNPAALYIHEIAGVATSAALDKIHFAKTHGTVSASFDSLSTAATTNANEFVLGAFVAGLTGAPSWTLGAGYTNLLQNNNTSSITSAAESKIISASATQNATATLSVATQGGIAVVVTFSDTAVAVAPHISHAGTTFNTTTGTHTLAAGVLAGDLIAIVRANTGNVTSTAPTDNNAGGAGTYVLATSALNTTSADLMEVWVRTATIVTAGSTTFSDAAGVTTGGGISVFRLTGMARTGSAAVKQVASQPNHASGSAPAPVFGASVLTGNMVLASVLNAGTSTGALTEKAGYQRANLDRYTTPTTALQSMTTDSGETGTTITWGSSSATAYASTAVEFDTSAAGSTTPVGKDMMNLNNNFGAVVFQARTRGSNY